MGEIEVRKTLKKLGHLLAAKLAAMPAGSHGAEIIVCPPHEIAISLQPLDRGPWAFPEKDADEVHLTPTEEAIVAACSKTTPRLGKELARKSGAEYDGSFRRTLSNLRRKGVISKVRGGYVLT